MSTKMAELSSTRMLNARIFALTTLVAFTIGAIFLAIAVAEALSDSWVAPISLTPDNDAVMQLKIRHNQMIQERDRLEAHVVRTEGQLTATKAAIEQLQHLRGDQNSGVNWTVNSYAKQLHAVGKIRHNLEEQALHIKAEKQKQDKSVADASKDLAAGLIDQATFESFQQAAQQLALTHLQNERERLQIGTEESKLVAEYNAWRRSGKKADAHATMPLLLEHQEHMAHLDIDILKLQGELRALEVEYRLAQENLNKTQGLLDEVKSRPLYRAIEARTDVAFVPYTQLQGVNAGDTVRRCTWVIFNCRAVGTVEEIVPGEVIMPDPWGNPSRGQYAILNLKDRNAVEEKTLRVRRYKLGL